MFAIMQSNNKPNCKDHEILEKRDLNAHNSTDMYDEYVIIELADVFELPKTDAQINQNQQHQVDMEIKHARSELEKFLKQLKSQAKKDFIKHMESTIEHVYHCSNQGKSWLEMADHIQNFYERMPHRMSTDKLYKGLSAELSDTLMDRAEKYMMVKLYNSTFCPPTTDDRQKDLNIQTKIQNLHWTAPRHLDVPINDQDPQVCSLFVQAITEITKINSSKAPQDKLSRILQCSKYIVEMVQVSKSRFPNADDMISSLVYIIMKANPPNLKSNVQYLIRFANPARLGTGEIAYCFTTMICAVTFIESMAVKSLSLTRQEYNQYTSKEVRFPHTANMFISEELRLKYENLKTLAELQQRHDKVMSEALRLQQDMKEFKDSFKQEMGNTLSRTPEVQPMEMEVQSDSNSDSEELPPTMILEPAVSQTLSVVPGNNVQNDVESVTVTQALSVVPDNYVQNYVESVAVTQALSVVPDSYVQNDVESVSVIQALSVVPDNYVQNDVESVSVIQALSVVPDNYVQNDVESVSITQTLSVVPDNYVQNDVDSVTVTQAVSVVPDNYVQNDVESVTVTQTLSVVPDNYVQNDVESVSITQTLSVVPDNYVQNDVESVSVTQAVSVVPDNYVQNDVESVTVTQTLSVVPDNYVQNDVESFTVTQSLSVVPDNYVQNDVESVTVTQALSVVPDNYVQNDVESVTVTQTLSVVPDNYVQNDVESVTVTQALSVVPDNYVQNDVESVSVTQALSVVPDNHVQNDVESVTVTKALSVVPDNHVQNDVESVSATQALSIISDNFVQNHAELAAELGDT